MKTPNLNRYGAFPAWGTQAATLTGTVLLVLVTTGVSGELLLKGRLVDLNPGAASRIVKLPAVADCEGLELYLRHSGSTAGTVLLVQTSAGVAIGTIVQGERVRLACAQATWRMTRSVEAAIGSLNTVVYEHAEDFFSKPTGTLPGAWTTQDTSAAGAPTLDYGADAAGGTYVLKLDTTNEVEAITLYQGDQRMYPVGPSNGLYWEARIKFEPDVTGASGNPAVGDKIVIGLGSDRNATLDNMVQNCWFLIGGAADMVLRVEADDNTVDADDLTTGTTIVSGTWYTLAIDFTNPTAGPSFYVNGTRVATLATVVAMNANLQTYIEVAKVAAANKDHRLTVDYVYVRGTR